MFHRLFSPRLLRPLFWALCAFALIMALLPAPPHTAVDRFGDKVEHMLAFGTLAVVAALAWREVRWTRLLIWLSAFGAAIEVLQAIPVVHRDSDWKDWVADTAVALVVLWLTRFVAARLVPTGRAFD